MTLLCLVSSDAGLEFTKDRSAYVTLEAASDLAVAASFGAAPRKVSRPVRQIPSGSLYEGLL